MTSVNSNDNLFMLFLLISRQFAVMIVESVELRVCKES